MQFAARHIQTAVKLIESYNGAVPLPYFLKQFFASHKKYGSKDRKAISHACYCFYRTGHALKDIPSEEKIKAGIFLCTNEAGIWSAAFSDDWIENWSSDISKRTDFVSGKYELSLADIFPLHKHISDAIDKTAFERSHLVQPHLYIRIRPGKEKKIAEQLSAAGIPYERCSDSCIALPNSTKIDQVVSLNKDAVVQDISSQRIAEFLRVTDPPSSTEVWDCCAASGGKSILAVDVLKDVDLTVSDVRSSIIQNLKNRFKDAGIHNYRSFVADISDDKSILPGKKYDLVICDVPCSGSGTWGRSPEQMYFFKEEKISYYAALQKKIVTNVIPFVREKGYFLYITCSVFKEENENIVEHILSNTKLRLQKMEVLKGYDKKADTMFAALFTASPL